MPAPKTGCRRPETGVSSDTSRVAESRVPESLSAVRPERAFERNPHQLAAGPDPRLLKQLLQRCLDRAIANAELGANLLIGETLEYASQHLLLAFGQQGADSLLLPLVNPIGHELNHFRID